MTIEIFAPNLQVKEKLIDGIKRKVLTLSHFAENISRAEVYLTEHREIPDQNKSCKIRLSIFGETIFVQKYGESFDNAFKSAVSALKRNLKKKIEKRNSPPDEITSTVEI